MAHYVYCLLAVHRIRWRLPSYKFSPEWSVVSFFVPAPWRNPFPCQVSLDGIFETEFWPANASMSFLELGVKDLLWQPSVVEPDEMSCPSEVAMCECFVHAGHVSFHQDVLVGDTMPPFDTQDLPQVPHHVGIQTVSLGHVHCPRFCSV